MTSLSRAIYEAKRADIILNAKLELLGAGGWMGEMGENHATYPEFGDTVSKSYVSNPALDTQDSENHPSSEYSYNLCVQKQREAGITDMDYIDNVCRNEELGGPKNYSQEVKYGNTVKARSAAVQKYREQVPAYLLTIKGSEQYDRYQSLILAEQAAKEREEGKRIHSAVRDNSGKPYYLVIHDHLFSK